ncbi:hypothetical protein [Streptomyces sp. SID3343]|uniref:hypothetical protein n=1 Tax=Streptomyces sp. SID3343 TaxID=2690260 RepID=UPI00136DA173|nr:hypothetical protein [Streptomyces sp. SID3343]MYW05456.1 hypothetical protein [Streptomyces sp. SID3343]
MNMSPRGSLSPTIAGTALVALVASIATSIATTVTGSAGAGSAGAGADRTVRIEQGEQGAPGRRELSAGPGGSPMLRLWQQVDAYVTRHPQARRIAVDTITVTGGDLTVTAPGDKKPGNPTAADSGGPACGAARWTPVHHLRPCR